MKLVFKVFRNDDSYIMGYKVTLDGVEIASHDYNTGAGSGPFLELEEDYNMFIETIQRSLSMAHTPWEYSREESPYEGL